MTEKESISGVEAMRQLAKAQKNWSIFRAATKDGKDTIWIGKSKLTEEQLESIKTDLVDMDKALNHIIEIAELFKSTEKVYKQEEKNG